MGFHGQFEAFGVPGITTRVPQPNHSAPVSNTVSLATTVFKTRMSAILAAGVAYGSVSRWTQSACLPGDRSPESASRNEAWAAFRGEQAHGRVQWNALLLKGMQDHGLVSRQGRDGPNRAVRPAAHSRAALVLYCRARGRTRHELRAMVAGPKQGVDITFGRQGFTPSRASKCPQDSGRRSRNPRKHTASSLLRIRLLVELPFESRPQVRLIDQREGLARQEILASWIELNLQLLETAKNW